MEVSRLGRGVTQVTTATTTTHKPTPSSHHQSKRREDKAEAAKLQESDTPLDLRIPALSEASLGIPVTAARNPPRCLGEWYGVDV